MHDKGYGTGETRHGELPSGARAPDGGNRASREPRTSPAVDTVDPQAAGVHLGDAARHQVEE
ncbi:hypothetical protein, partial [Streptomyces solaniscabiei]|uniref:hypothetical protein n=1 Tax=Streptomyces solaniscabiei TaxID=2683255 RepID=UPI001CE2D5F6